MKRKDLERELKRAGWWFVRHGGLHDVWTDGVEQTTIPRHKEINELTAKGILRFVKGVKR